MKKIYLVFWLGVVAVNCLAKESITPVITPTLFRYNDNVSVTYDVTGTSLADLTNAYLWVWMPEQSVDAKYNVNPASNDPTKTNVAKLTKSTDNGKTYFTITFKPSDFFSSDISTLKQIGMLLKGNDWSDGQTTDYVTTFWDGTFQIKLTSPAQQPLFVTTAAQINIQAETPVAGHYVLYIDGVQTNEQDNITQYSYQHTVTETSGSVIVKLVVTAGANSAQTTFQYIISQNSASAIRPAGIVDGINYDPADNTKVTLCIWAPGKNSVYVRGDFSDWNVLPENLMKKDGEHFWIEIDNLIAGTEYGFQYLINESVFVADPYADKILDPDDQYIPASTYPDLKSFPTKALSDKWYFNRVAVFQTGQQPYTWQVSVFQKPAKENLVIYELLMRDFLGADARSYKTLADTISYLKRLGVNAVELMPIMEFNGNDSWGYNPTFMFAPDKFYGTKNALKDFVDKCHQQGIAVIFDIAMNHHDAPNPYVLMDFDFSTFLPTPNNKWFNVTATHPYSVFFDMNHESPYTQAYLDTVTNYWLREYHIDGYRFDLSKGFTQTYNPNDVNAWSAYDASRIAILKRMSDKIWAHFPDAYVILEHFAANAEEKELAEYRANEDKGMMPWGNFNNAYNQNTMGFGDKSDFSSIYFVNRNWTVPHLVGYMESHDEERLMYKNITYGNASGSYSVKTLSTALSRVKAASTLFYTIPGPKMLWEFGELGYDLSINRCSDGTIGDCRVTAKPAKWEYLNNTDRKSLFTFTADLIRLRNTYDVFTAGDASVPSSNSLLKQITLKNRPYNASPSMAADMNVQIVANFDVTNQTFLINFPHTGTWYDYYAHGKAVNVGSTPMSFSLAPGEYKLFTDVEIENPLPVITAVSEEIESTMRCYPNPVSDVVTVQSENGMVDGIEFYSLQGQRVIADRLDSERWSMRAFETGLYVMEIHANKKIYRIKVLKK